MPSLNSIKIIKKLGDRGIQKELDNYRKEVLLVSTRQKDQMIEISVQDQGPGISEEDRNRLFQKFGRLEGSFVASAERGGTGLGLYITKRLVELHGGKIWVESGEGKGSTFTFSLPAQAGLPVE